MTTMITCLYSCDNCGLQRVKCAVPARTDETIDVWMGQTIRLVSADHRRRSPGCHVKAMQELAIPVTGTKRVGGPVLQ